MANQALQVLIHEETPGDGNCFFWAIEQQLLRPEIASSIPPRVLEAGTDHSQLRTGIVNFAERISALHPTFQIAIDLYVQRKGKPGEPASLAWKRCCQEMKRNGTWAEDVFIEAAAFYLEKDIFVTSQTNPKGAPWTRMCCHQHDQVCPQFPITLVQVNQNHFQSIWPDDTMQKCFGCGASTFPANYQPISG